MGRYAKVANLEISPTAATPSRAETALVTAALPSLQTVEFWCTGPHNQACQSGLIVEVGGWYNVDDALALADALRYAAELAAGLRGPLEDKQP